jgi:hypothetical protein
LEVAATFCGLNGAAWESPGVDLPLGYERELPPRESPDDPPLTAGVDLFEISLVSPIILVLL